MAVRTEENTVQAQIGDVHTAYFYYVRVSATGAREVLAYEEFDIKKPLGDFQKVTKRLIQNAQTPGGRDPAPYSEDFDALFRRRKGYLIVAVQGAKFDPNNPIEFKCDEASDSASVGSDGRHTFLPLGQFEEKTNEGDVSVAAYHYVAKLHTGQRDLCHGEWEHYQFDLPGSVRRFDDSGGTNMGPPPPPPARKAH
jgi:hypothetical protein